MKRANIKVLSFILSTFLALSTPIGVLADNVTNDSIGSSNMEDKESNVGVDSTQGQETTYSEDITTSKEESTLVYVSQASTFSVVIPKTIILDGKTKSATYEVLVNGNIGGIENVNVIPDSEFVMSQKGKNDIKAIVTQDKTSWVYNEFETKANGSIAANDMTAGSWKGTFNFTIELKSTPFIKVNATNSSGADLNATVSFITGTNKTTLLNELVDGGFIANENEVNALINVETDDFEDTATTTIDVSNFAKKDDIIAIYHYDETLGEWEYITTCTVDENGKIIANFNSFSPIAFVKKETNHEHSYTSEMIIEPTCAIKGTTKYTCECGYSYTKQDIETIAHNVVNSKCTNCDYDEYVPFTLTSSNINMVGIEATGDMVIPETFEYEGTIYKITKIGDFNYYPDNSKTFYGNTNITSVTLPNSVTNIENYAFYNCSNLTKINIPNNVTRIGGSAFYGCSNLTKINIPNNVTQIGNSVFSNCSNLSNINVEENNNTYCSIDGILFSKDKKTIICYPSGKTTPIYNILENVTNIANYAFYGCTNLTNVTIPNSVTNIGICAFSGCTELTSIQIPESVIKIESNAFEKCTSLVSIEIPNSITSIGNSTFSNCTNLKDVILPNNITNIKAYTFENCSNLTNITIPESVTSIGTLAFYGCTSLTKVTIPNSVTSIKSGTFKDCINLTNIIIPNNVKTIEAGAFNGCIGLTSVEIPENVTSIGNNAFYNVKHIIYNGVATGSPWGAKKVNDEIIYTNFTLTSSNINMVGLEATGDIVIPETFEYENVVYKITNISDTAFAGNTNITSITIPDSVKYIGHQAFDGCTNLKNVKLSCNLTSIGSNAFYNCINLTSIDIPNSVTTIYSNAFYNVPHINYTGTATGSPWGARRINDITEYIPFTLMSSNVNMVGISASGNMVIPSIFEYNGTYYEITQIGEQSGTMINRNNVFSENQNIKSITIPNSVKTISGYAFSDCTNLTKVTIPNSVTSIGKYAFSNCTNLTSINIPNSITNISKGMFYSCKSLTSIDIPNSVTHIGQDAFYNCTSLNVEIPSTVKTIDIDAFYYVPEITYYGTATGSPWSALKLNKVQQLVPFTLSPANIHMVGIEATGNMVIPETFEYDGVNYIITQIGYGYPGGNQNFSSNTNLTSVTIPNSVTKIGTFAFYGCTNLTNVTLPNNLKDIEYYSFYNCTSLTNVNIPSNVSYIDSNAFGNVPHITYTGSLSGSPWGAKSIN